MRGVFCCTQKYFFGLLVLLSIACYFVVFPPTARALSSEALVELTNQERQAQGLAPLTANKKLESAAYAKAYDMQSSNYWDHTSPDGVEPWSFIRASGYDYQYAGENLAKDFVSDDAIVRAWMDSPSHRANVLSDTYTEIGIAVMNVELLGKKTNLVVAHYGKPKVSHSEKVKGVSLGERFTAYVSEIKDSLRTIKSLVKYLFEPRQLLSVSIVNYSIFERR